MINTRLIPVAVKFMQFIASYRILNSVKHAKPPQFNQFYSKAMIASTGLAFIWPAKKVNKGTVDSNVPNISSVLEQADNLFENGQYEECFNILCSCKHVPNVEVSWRKCRVLYNMSKEPKYDKKYKKELVLEAYSIISDELPKNKNHFAVQKWYALLLDAKCTYDGIKERIKQLENIKNHMDLAVTLNPTDATTLHMLGEWCYQVSELPWHQRRIAEALFASPPQSTYEDALEYFLRAEAAQPRFYSINLLRIGNCYMRLQKEDQAKYYLKLAASYPAKSNDDHRANREAADLLHKLK